MPEFEINPRARNNLPDRLAVEIQSRITTGVYQGLLPTMEEIAREIGVSRLSVRSAIKILEAEGVVTVRQGKGTFVAGSPELNSITRRTPRPAQQTEASALPEEIEAIEEERESISLGEIYAGIGLYLFTKRRIAEIVCAESPVEYNQLRLKDAVARELVLAKLGDAVMAEPENSLLALGLINVFNKEVSEIAKAHSLGDALVEAAESTN